VFIACESKSEVTDAKGYESIDFHYIRNNCVLDVYGIPILGQGWYAEM
jgi:hypothetical protein